MGLFIAVVSSSKRLMPRVVLSGAALVFIFAAFWPAVSVATDLQEIKAFHAWSLYCRPEVKVSTDCSLAQGAQAFDNSSVEVRAAVSYRPSGGLGMKLRVEPAPFRAQGIALLVDDDWSETVDVGYCDAKGCTTDFVIPGNLWSRLLTGRELTVQYRFEMQEGTSLALNLPGLTEGISEMRKRVAPTNIVTVEDWTKYINTKSSSSFEVGLVDVTSAENSGAADFANVMVSALCAAASKKLPDALSFGIPVLISVDSNFQAIQLTKESSDKVKNFVKLTQDCGDMFKVAVKAGGSSPSESVSPVFLAYQKTAVKDYLIKAGLPKDKVWMVDDGTGMPIRQPGLQP